MNKVIDLHKIRTTAEIYYRLGLFLGRTQPKDLNVNKTIALSKELHDIFRENHKSLCCRVLTKDMALGFPKHKEQCIRFTGEVAEVTAKLIIRDLNLEAK